MTQEEGEGTGGNEHLAWCFAKGEGGWVGGREGGWMGGREGGVCKGGNT